MVKMIFGVLISEKIFLSLINGKNIRGLKLLACEAVKEGVKIIVFSPKGIDWIDRSIDGAAYNALKDKWEPEKSSFPDIIYDRGIFNREEKALGKLARKRFKKEYEIQFINNKHYFNKWAFHKTFSAYEELKRYLPGTEVCKDSAALVRFINKYNTVYIKDSNGSRGENIYRVEMVDNEQAKILYQDKEKVHEEKINLQDIYQWIKNGKLSNKKVILQQGIELASVEGRPFDIRLLVQKNHLGVWQIVDKSARIGASDKSIITNISNGGEARKFNDIVEVVFPEKSLTICDEVDKLVYNVCIRLEQKYGHLGELGIDLALDKYGVLWILEVNGKPAKTCVMHSKDKKSIHSAYNNIIQYSRYLVEKNQ